MRGESLKTVYGDFAADFVQEPLMDLCDSANGVQTGPFGSQLHQKDYVPVGTPIITVEHLGDNRIIHEDVPRVSDEDRQRLSKYTLRKGDIVFSRVGSVDRRALVREAEDGWLFSGRCLRIRPDPNRIDPGYLSYFFGLPSFKEYIRAIAVGATMPSLNTDLLSNVPIPHPRDLSTQRAIAHILGTLDDKIELNRKMNRTLEAIARAIFKSWFVDFDPVIDNALAAGKPIPEEFAERVARRVQLTHGKSPLPENIRRLFPDEFQDSELGPIPKGWEVKEVGECIVRHTVGKKYDQKTVSPVGKVPVLDQGKSGIIGYHNGEPGVFASIDKPIAVFANHTCYMRLITFSFSAIQNVIPFTGKEMDTVWVYYATYGIQPFLEYKGHWPDFVAKKIIVPSRLLTTSFTEMIMPLITKSKYVERESLYLENTRDVLLPKLISGKLRVRDAERFLEAKGYADTVTG